MDTCINGRVRAVTSINLWIKENFVKENNFITNFIRKINVFTTV